MPLCPLQLHEIPLVGGYCSDCAICKFCQKQLTVLEYNWCLSIAAKYDTTIEFQHPGCFSEVERTAIGAENITIPRIVFEKLNATRLLIEPIPELSEKTNQLDSSIKIRQFVHEMKLEDQFIVLKRLESMASEVNLLLSKHRDAIKSLLSERDKEKFAKAKLERQQSKDLAPRTHGLETKRKLTKEEKAIAALVNIGLTEAQAKESIKRKVQ